MPKPKFYAVKRGLRPGIYNTWPECEAQVKGFQGAQFKGFWTRADAESFVNGGDAFKNTGWAKAKPTKSRFDPPGAAGGAPKAAKKRSFHEAFETGAAGNLTTGAGTSSLSQTEADRREAAALDAVVEKARAGGCDGYEVTGDGFVVCYTDGSCFGNGRRGACAGLGVYFGPGHEMNISAPVLGRQTNNRAEILAVQFAVEVLKAAGLKKMEIRTDSQFMMNCMQKWIKGWKRNGWKTANGEDVKNKEELLKLDQAVRDVVVRYVYVPGHSGNIGNEGADYLARAGAEKSREM